MKEIRWAPDAADDIVRIIEYIRRDNSTAAQRIALSVLQRIASLKRFPGMGRSGRVDGTRELALPPLPFIVVYRVKAIALRSPECCTVRNAGLNQQAKGNSDHP